MFTAFWSFPSYLDHYLKIKVISLQALALTFLNIPISHSHLLRDIPSALFWVHHKAHSSLDFQCFPHQLMPFLFWSATTANTLTNINIRCHINPPSWFWLVLHVWIFIFRTLTICCKCAGAWKTKIQRSLAEGIFLRKCKCKRYLHRSLLTQNLEFYITNVAATTFIQN